MRRGKGSHHKDHHEETSQADPEVAAAAEVEETSGESQATGADGNGAAPTQDSRVEELQARLQEKEEEARRSQDQYLRALADLDNSRKRLRQEKEEAIEYANAGLVLQLLPILDNFELAVRHSEGSRDFDGLLQGVKQILRQMQDTLKKAGVEPIEAVGQPFNPDEHEAIGHAPADGHEEGSVVQDLRTGYRMKGRCIRPSLVKVAG